MTCGIERAYSPRIVALSAGVWARCVPVPMRIRMLSRGMPEVFSNLMMCGRIFRVGQGLVTSLTTIATLSSRSRSFLRGSASMGRARASAKLLPRLTDRFGFKTSSKLSLGIWSLTEPFPHFRETCTPIPAKLGHPRGRS